MKAHLAAIAAAMLAMQVATAQDETLVPQTQNGITTVCGGIGADEVVKIKREASRYHLMLTFADTRGEFLADVGIAITGPRGEPLLQTTCDAPILLVRFEQPGDYRVNAEVDGHTVSQQVHIGRDKGTLVALVWPSERLAGR